MPKNDKLSRIDLPVNKGSGTVRVVGQGGTTTIINPTTPGGLTELPAHAYDSAKHTGTLSWEKINMTGSELTDLASTGTAGQLVEADGAGAIAYIDSDNDGTAADVILRSGDTRYLTMKRYIASDSAADPVLQVINTSTSDSATLTMDVSTRTAKITGNAATYLEFVLTAGRIDLDKHIQTLQSIYSDGYAGTGNGGIKIDFGSGFADIPTLHVDRLTADAFIAAVKQALVGGQIIGKSVTTLTREFTVPGTQGGTGVLYVKDIPGLGGMDAFAVGDDLIVRYLNLAEGSTGTAALAQVVSGYAASGSGSTTTHLDEDFESYTPPADPTNWKLDTTGNSTAGSGAADWATFVDPTDGTNVTFGPDATAGDSNYHAHYNGTGADALADYRYTCRFYLDGASAADAGLGFTVLSKYADGSPADTYVRVRRYTNTGSNSQFHVNNHGYAAPTGGTTASSFSPSTDTWYNVKIEIEDDGSSRTDLRVRFWAEGDTEPGAWDIDCYWTGGSRPQTGTFGFWAYGTDSGEVLYDNVLVESLATSSVSVTESVTLTGKDVAIALVTSDVASVDAVNTVPAGFTLIDNIQANGYRTSLYESQSPSGSSVTFGSSTADYLHVTVITFDGVDETNRQLLTTSYTSDTQSFIAPDLVTDTVAQLTFYVAHTHGATNTDQGFTGTDYAAYAPQDGTESSHLIRHRLTDDDEDDPTFTLASAAQGGVWLITYESLSTDAGRGVSFGPCYLHVDSAYDDSGDAFPDQVKGDEQAWNVTLISTTGNNGAEGATLQAESTVVDIGQYSATHADNSGVWEVTTLDSGSGGPYSQIKMRGSTDPTDWDVALRNGYLGGLPAVGGSNHSAAAGVVGLWFKDVTGTSGQEAMAELSTSQAALQNIGLRMYDGTNAWLEMNVNDGINLLADASATTFSDIYSFDRGYTFTQTVGGTEMGGLYAHYFDGASEDQYIVKLAALGATGVLSSIDIFSEAANKGADVDLRAFKSGGTAGKYARAALNSYSDETSYIVIEADEIELAPAAYSGATMDLIINADEIRDDDGWQTITAATNWTSYATPYGPPQYKKIGDFVFLRGLFRHTGGTRTGLGTTETVAGTGAVPSSSYQSVLAGVASTNSGVSTRRIDVTTGGAIQLRNFGGTLVTDDWVSINGMFYSIA